MKDFIREDVSFSLRPLRKKAGNQTSLYSPKGSPREREVDSQGKAFYPRVKEEKERKRLADNKEIFSRESSFFRDVAG
jgi:hypothetical protein